MTKSSETLHQTLSLMTVAFNELTIGMANGWVAPTLNTLQTNSEFSLDAEDSSWIASLDNFGKIFGSIFTALVLDTIGRKPLLTSSALVFFLMWLVTSFTHSIPMLCLTRFIFGIFVGINDSTNSTYLAENSSPLIRGIFGTVCITLYYTGLLGEFFAATYLSYNHTSYFNAIVTFLALLSVLWIREPVQFLLLKGKLRQAEKTYSWLYGSNASQFQKIKNNVQQEQRKKISFKKTISAPANYKSLFIMIVIYCLVGSIGYFPIISYASLSFSTTDIFTSNEFTILFGIAQLLVVISTSFLIGRFNRRTILLISFTLITFCHIVTAVLYHVHEHIVQIPYYPWLIFAAITLFATTYAFVYPVIFLIRGELFPLSVKATGSCLSIIGFSIMSFVMTKIFLSLRSAYGIEANFLIFSIVSLILTSFVYFLLPETKNKSLIEIQEILETNRIIVR